MRELKSIKIGNFTLEKILDKHQHWLNQDCKGWESMCAYLRDVNLSNVNLCGVDLRWGNLCYANLRYANLRHTDLRYADLRCANLCGADLLGADLDGAKLCGANLCGANLCNANLCNADLDCTNLYNAKGNDIEYRKGRILTESIIGYKKCKDNIIVTLEIPRGAIVFSINGNKCRTNKVKVISIDGADRAYSTYYYMSYYVGDEFTIYDFDCEYNGECGEGIHFFMTREEAEKY